jgi:hypothetical protein
MSIRQIQFGKSRTVEKAEKEEDDGLVRICSSMQSKTKKKKVETREPSTLQTGWPVCMSLALEGRGEKTFNVVV